MTDKEDAIMRGNYERCKLKLKKLGIDDQRAEVYCSHWLSVDDGPKLKELEIKKEEKTKVLVTKKKKKQKPKAMQLPVQPPIRAPPSQHLLRTKMEKMLTQEQKLLTHEELLRRKEYMKMMHKDSSSLIWGEDTTNFESFNHLKNVTKVPVILAKEMVQIYKKDGRDEYHFKPFDELKKSIKGVEELPIIIEHKQWNESDVVGYVRELKADSERRLIKGTAYIIDSKLPKFLLARILQKMIVPVSIGFWANILNDAGTYLGEAYDFVQSDIYLNHLAICINSIPRCPPDQCGINHDSEKKNDEGDFEIKTPYAQYININNKKNEIEETEYINNANNNGGDKILVDDYKPIIAISHSAEGEDLTKLLAKLREFVGIIPPDKKSDAEDIISEVMKIMIGDQKMEDSKLQEEIAKLKSEITQLKDSLKTKEDDISLQKEIIDSYEKDMRDIYIKTIKEYFVFEDSELEGKCVKELKVLSDAAPKVSTKLPIGKRLPMGLSNKELEDAKEKLKKERIDPSTIWVDYKGEED